MSLIIFESQIDLLNMPLPATGAFYVGYDALTGKLSQKDSDGVITLIGGSSGSLGLSDILAVNNNTGTYSISLHSGSVLKSDINSAQIKLDNGVPGAGIVNISTDGVLAQSYLFMNPNSLILKSLNKSLVFSTNFASLQFDTNNIISIASNQYSISLGGLKVLEFSNAVSSIGGNRISAIISSNGSTLSSGIVNSVVLGGVSQNATQSNSVYVPDLYVQNGKVIKGSIGSSYLKFSNTNDAYLHGTSHIGLLSSTNILTSNGISIRDTLTASSTANVDTDITYISSRNSSNISGLKNTLVIGGDNINATYSNTTYIGGSVSINGKYILPQIDGNDGEVLQTDGFGNLIWGSVSVGDFGTTSGTVAEGNDVRILNGQTAFGWGNHAGLYTNYTGVGSTGTWSISISGNSETSTTANNSNNWGNNLIINDYITDINNAMIAFGEDDSWHYVSSLTVSDEIRDYANGTWDIDISGNALTSTTLQTARNINGVPFDGSANITLPDVKIFKEYAATLNQSSTFDPTSTVIINELSGAIVWVRNSIGQYDCTLIGEFVDGEVALGLSPKLGFYEIFRQSVDIIRIETFNTSGVLSDGILKGNTISIRIKI